MSPKGVHVRQMWRVILCDLKEDSIYVIKATDLKIGRLSQTVLVGSIQSHELLKTEDFLRLEREEMQKKKPERFKTWEGLDSSLQAQKDGQDDKQCRWPEGAQGGHQLTVSKETDLSLMPTRKWVLPTTWISLGTDSHAKPLPRAQPSKHLDFILMRPRAEKSNFWTGAP